MTTSLAQSLDGGSPVIWAIDFLHRAQLPTTLANIQCVYSWEYAESAGGGGMWNPLNTTQGGYTFETNFNSVGVKNYVRRDDGLNANAKVIHNGFYPHVLEAFRVGDDARATCDAITASPWGTGPIALRPLPGPVPQPPPPIGAEMQFVPLVHDPMPADGSTPQAVWNPANPDVVTLEHHASLKLDQPLPNGDRVWRPVDAHGHPIVPPGHHGTGISFSVDTRGRPDGRGIVMRFTGGLTYIGERS